tara:strand:- start:178 stop:636 length:459 start_codon:yes stop_codon:yes gene_type:complete
LPQQLDKCFESADLCEVVQEVLRLSVHEVLLPSDVLPDRVYIVVLVSGDPACLEVDILVHPVDGFRAFPHILVVVDIKSEAAMAAAEESMHQAHELGDTLHEGGFLVDEGEVWLRLELLEAPLLEGGRLFEPSHNESDDRVEELKDLIDLFL